MRRKVHDLRDWTGALEDTERFQVVAEYLMADFTAHRVRQPLTVDFDGEPLRLSNHGWRWIRAHPLTAPAGVVGDALTVLLDRVGQPLELYIDIHAGGGIDPVAGRPWIEDLYLDIAALFGPGWQPRHLLLLDADELAAAQAGGRITGAQAEAAHSHAASVLKALRRREYAPLQAVRAYVHAQLE
ncbi:DUF402 domain-containing protein [Deinococcus lacus]|uniref:DUF402 domain-containing protein n=1 Tax=Deinococcus lacus TaxID=392561 RepID=A0ABW1YF33_9DEIO